MPLIRVQNLKKHYQQGKMEVPALRDLSFEIQPGEFTAIVGPSGSGKTTLLNIIGALDNPDEGKVFIEGQDLGLLKKNQLPRFRLENIGFVFQFYNLVPVFTALENVEYPLLLKGISKGERKKRALELLSEMDLVSLGHRLPRELSGGQQQRVAVARSLISEPKVVLADEPTANLDSVSADRLLDIMQEMSSKKNITFLFSTHDKRVMERANRLIQIRDGQLVI